MMTDNSILDPVIDWLMEGDPAIRWQTLRDLLGAPEQEWRAEQKRTLAEGWGAQLLAVQDPDGRWGGGIYSPKWISTTYTLLLLCSIGIPPETPAARIGAQRVINGILGETCSASFHQNLAACDRCIVGMVLQIAVYFGIEDDRIQAIVTNLLSEQMPDGGWNCRRTRRPQPHHSSFHTTFNVLEGLRVYLEQYGTAQHTDVLAAEQQALELMLQHRLYQSDHTGAVIDPKFTLLSFPARWHYDILRGLDYFARAGAPHDHRLEDAVSLLYKRKQKDGRWLVQHKYAGRVFFDLEKTGGASRWNTLRAMRVIRWWERT
jgi:hypothetical protein